MFGFHYNKRIDPIKPVRTKKDFYESKKCNINRYGYQLSDVPGFNVHDCQS